METTTRLQNYTNEEETERCTTNALIPVKKYTGLNKRIYGKSGVCWFSQDDSVWYFKPDGSYEWYRVKNGENLGVVEQ